MHLKVLFVAMWQHMAAKKGRHAGEGLIMHIVRAQAFIVLFADINIGNLTVTHRRSLRGRSRTGGLHWNRPDNPRTNHQQRGNKPQSTVKAAGQIFQPADHKRT